MGAESWDRQAGETNKGRHARNLDRPEPKTVFVEMLLDVIDHWVALGLAETAPEERHDARIGIHDGECVPSPSRHGRRQTRPPANVTHPPMAARSPAGQTKMNFS